MATEKNSSGVDLQINKIRRQYWLILLAATGPFFVLSIIGVLSTDMTEGKVLVAASFIFGFGLALIATKVAAHTAIERQLSVIEDIDDIKSEFIAIAAHQLKTPVSALMYSLEALETAYQKDDHENLTYFLRDLRGSGHRLNLLARNLLNVTLLDNHASNSYFERLPVIEYVTKVIDELEPVQSLHSITLETTFSVSPDTEIYDDGNLFYNVLENLLSNAYKYSIDSDPVSITITDSDEEVYIAIKNKTKPMSEDELEKIFERYTQGSVGMTINSDGFGLGLYISRQFVESWGGNMTATMITPEEIEFRFSVLKPTQTNISRLSVVSA